MRFVSLFSGIEAASVAWMPLGWEAVAFAEIEPFPCAVLAQRFPDVPNLGDVTKIDWSDFLARYGAVDLVCGGSPCQSFSIAGGRESLDGESRLMFEYIRAVRELRPRWFVWENVPGVLNTRDDAFGCLLDQMDESGYSTAWRMLDAQFFGVAQRRARVWAVGASRDAFGDLAAGRAAAVLFERESVRGNTQSSKQKRQELARAAYERSSGGFKWHQGAGAGNIGYEDEQSPTLVADWHNPAVLLMQDTQCDAGIEHEMSTPLNCMHEQPIVCVGSDSSKPAVDVELRSTLHAEVGAVMAKAYTLKTRCGADTYIKRDGTVGTAGKGALAGEDVSFTLAASQDQTLIALDGNDYIVRRLTPTECERLQGFSDGWTDVEYRGKPAADGPRYKALGNSWAVPCARWIGERIEMVERLMEGD